MATLQFIVVVATLICTSLSSANTYFTPGDPVEWLDRVRQLKLLVENGSEKEAVKYVRSWFERRLLNSTSERNSPRTFNGIRSANGHMAEAHTNMSKQSQNLDARQKEIQELIVGALGLTNRKLPTVSQQQLEALESRIKMVSGDVDKQNDEKYVEDVLKEEYITCSMTGKHPNETTSYSCQLDSSINMISLTACPLMHSNETISLTEVQLCRNRSHGEPTDCLKLWRNDDLRDDILIDKRPARGLNKPCWKVNFKSTHNFTNSIKHLKILQVSFQHKGAHQLEVVVSSRIPTPRHGARTPRALSSRRKCRGGCCVENKSVDLVTDLGLEFVVYPKKINFGMCTGMGTCRFGDNEPVWNHLSENQQPCCSPWEMKSVTLITTICSDGQLVQNGQGCMQSIRIPNMRIISCRCSAYISVDNSLKTS